LEEMGFDGKKGRIDIEPEDEEERVGSPVK
jgi:hypothetical protein